MSELKIGSAASVQRSLTLGPCCGSTTSLLQWVDQALPPGTLLRVYEVAINITPYGEGLGKKDLRQFIDHMVENGQVRITVEGFGELWCSSFIPFPEDGAGHPPAVCLQKPFDILANDHVWFGAALAEPTPGGKPVKLVIDVRATGRLFPQRPTQLALTPVELRLLHSALTQLAQNLRDDRIGLLQDKLGQVANSGGALAVVLEGDDALGRQLAHDLYRIASESGPEHLDQLIAILQQLKEQTKK